MANNWDKYKSFSDIENEPSLIEYHAERFVQGARDNLARQAYQYSMMQKEVEKRKNG